MAKNVNIILKLKDEFTSKIRNAEGEVQKFNKDFKKTNAQLQKTAKQLNKTGTNIQSFGNKLTKSITLPAVGAATALAGIALKKGWDRMASLDEARAKLTALGNDTEAVSKIMDNALASVRGTAFGMDEAATTAASAVAAGIKPGKDLQSYLTSVADAAAIAGADMSDMGSIFNKIATSNKIQAEEINQLQDRGLPISSYLAKTLGVTASEVKDLASKGKIDLATFRKAVEDNLGGAAQTMGSSTISAAIKNMWASVGRIGSNFLGSSDDTTTFAGQILPIINSLKDKLTEIEPLAKEWGYKFGEAFTKATNKATELIKKFKELSPQAKKMIKIGALVVLGLGPAITVIGKVVSGVGKAINVFLKLKKAFGTIKTAMTAMNLVGLLANPVGLVVVGIAALAAGFVLLYKKSEGFRSFVNDRIVPNLQTAFEALKTAVEAVATAWQTLVDRVTTFIEKIKWIKENSQFLSILGLNGEEAKTNAKNEFATNITTRNAANIGNKATGTSYFKGGLTHINEGGRGELVNLPNGSQIVPASKVKSSGTNINVSVTVQGNMIGDTQAMEKFAEYTGRKILSAMGNV